MATNRAGRWGSSSSRTRNSTRSRTLTRTRSSGNAGTLGGSRVVSGYQSVCNDFDKKIASYRCLASQAKGPARCPRPTPATLNSFSRWIEKGAIIQKVSSTQIKRWAGTTSTTPTLKSATSAKTVLQNRFGKGCIKAVTCDKSGGFLVATPAIWKGRSFNFPRQGN